MNQNPYDPPKVETVRKKPKAPERSFVDPFTFALVLLTVFGSLIALAILGAMFQW